jgi:hypothetical protein
MDMDTRMFSDGQSQAAFASSSRPQEQVQAVQANFHHSVGGRGGVARGSNNRSQGRAGRGSGGRGASQQRTNSGSCHYCGKQGHFKRECRLRQLECYSCRQRGHKASDCPRGKQSANVVQENVFEGCWMAKG